MSQYSISSHGSSLRRRPLRCHCEKEAPLRTSWTTENPGRRFFGCGLFEKFGEKKCEFFDWYDEEMSARAKNVILSLMKKVDELKKEVAELKNNDGQLKKISSEFKEAKKVQEEMKIKMNMLWGFLAISWIIIVVLLFALLATMMFK